MGSIPERVARGVEWARVHAPDWATRVDPTTLSIASEHHCLLGQLFGHYRKGLQLFSDGTLTWASDRGFTLGPLECAFPNYYYTQLTDAWVEAIHHERSVISLMKEQAVYA